MAKAGVGYTSLPISALLQAQRSVGATHEASQPASMIGSTASLPSTTMTASSEPSIIRQLAASEPGMASIHDKLDVARERQRASALAEARQSSHRFESDLGACTIRSVSNGGNSSIPIVDLDQLQLHASPLLKTKELLRQFAPTLAAELRVIVAGKHSFGTQQYCVAVAPLGAALDQAVAAGAATPHCARFAEWLRDTFPVDFPPAETAPVAIRQVAPAPMVEAPAMPTRSPAKAGPMIQADEPPPSAQGSAQVSALFPKLAATPCVTSPWARNETIPASTLVDEGSANPILRILMDRFVLEKRRGDVFTEVRQLNAPEAGAACAYVEPATCSLAPDLLAALIAGRRASGEEVTILHPDESHDDAAFWQRFDASA